MSCAFRMCDDLACRPCALARIAPDDYEHSYELEQGRVRRDEPKTKRATRKKAA